MGFVIEQSDNRGQCGWLMPRSMRDGTRRVGIRAHAEVFPSCAEARSAIERLRPAFPAEQFHFRVSPDAAEFRGPSHRPGVPTQETDVDADRKEVPCSGSVRQH